MPRIAPRCPARSPRARGASAGSRVGPRPRGRGAPKAPRGGGNWGDGGGGVGEQGEKLQRTSEGSEMARAAFPRRA